MLIIAGYSIPSHTRFINFQRITKVEDKIVQIIANAQLDAQKEKTLRSVRFKTINGIPHVSQHSSSSEEEYKRFLDEYGFKPGQIEVFGQLDNLSITFDHRGTVISQIPYVIKVASPQRNSAISYRECVVVWTILGYAKKGASPSECPTRKGAAAPQGKIIYGKR